MTRFRKVLGYITIYLLIIMTTSLIYSEYMNLIFFINIFLSTFLVVKYRIFPDKKDLLFLWLISFILLILYVTTDGSYTLMSMMNTLTTIYFTIIYYKFNKGNFMDLYINIMVFICVVSVIGYISDVTNTFNFIVDKIPEIIKSNPELGNTHGGIFYVFRSMNHFDRNNGFAYEPGKYQYSINLAIYFILFCKVKISKLNRKLLVLIVTLITTMSTTGIIMGAILIFGNLFFKQNNVSKRFIFFSMIIGFIILVIFFYDKAYEIIIKKMQFNFDTKTFSYGSGNTRLNDIKLDLEIFINNIFGSGWKNYEEYWSIKQYGNNLYTVGSSSNSLTSMFAVYGVVFASFINAKYLFNFINKGMNALIIILLIFMYLYQNLSQSFSLMPLMVIFIINNNKELFGK